MQYHQGIYVPKNIKKYVGTKNPTFRSSWEYKMFQTLDMHPNVLQWASEPLYIPYKHPLTNTVSSYVPDLMIVWIDKHGKTRAEMIEIKPASQSYLSEARSKRDKLALCVNMAKWKSAQAFCKSRGLVFRVMTEKDLFRNTSTK